MLRNDRLADVLEAVSARGVRELYDGGLARAIAEQTRKFGGYLEFDDLTTHRTLPLTPVSAPFHGTEVWELPLPTQGPAVLEALQILERSGRYDTDSVMKAVLAGMKAAGIDLVNVRNPSAGRGDTTYVAAIDGSGTGVSLITSVFAHFGSCIGIEALGAPLQNRAGGIGLIGQRPRKGKPPHTTIPAVVTRDSELVYALGVAGGFMQPQCQVQVLLNLLVHGMVPQRAIDEPRFRVLNGGGVAVEPGHDLAQRDPEAVGRDTDAAGYGACQIASIVDGELDGGSDGRRGGATVKV
jgi:gamma-glutamyltranspeptidase/glutathione hydrolase